MDISADFDGKHYLARTGRIGQNIDQPASFNRFQDHFEGEAAILQALLVRVAGKNSHFEMLSTFSKQFHKKLRLGR
jgi:hypothetical protein